MSAPAALGGRPRVARFELLRELGRGAQATVWLAQDPVLEREVALKLIDSNGDPVSVNEWLHEARAVSRLSHPNIVPVFEADIDRAGTGHPYLVFEFVDGPTLGQARRRQPQWAARDAVQLMLGVLDGLAEAHAQGVVHRDLKPSNVLLGRDGRPRVMDFGIAAGVASTPDGRIVGTPGYMSPEAARGEAAHPAMDVFAAGMILGELLVGMPLLRERDPWRAIERLRHEDLKLPGDVRVDDTLRGIVQRAIARHPSERYDSARSMHAALSAWLALGATPAPEARHGTVEFLLRRMRHKTDFPALSEAVLRIQSVAASETANAGMLAEEILRDVALTNKLLRMVNSAHFTAVTGCAISTVSRAVQLVGFAGIRNMALAVLLLEHMNDQAHAAQLKDEFVRALMAGAVAAELAPMQREGEEVFLGSMFQNLGRLLTEYYFPEEAQQIRMRLSPDDETPAARNAAALRVLGIGLDELGIGVVRAWGLPESLQRVMRTPEGEAPGRPLPRGIERMRWLGRAANALTDGLLAGGEAASPERLLHVAEQYAATLDLSAGHIVGAAQAARGHLAQLTRALGLSVPAGASARRLLPLEPDGMHGLHGTRGTHDGLAVTRAQGAVAGSAAATLAEVLSQVGRALDDRSLRLNELLHLVLEAMHRSLDLRAVVLCLRAPHGGPLLGRFALGDVAAGPFRISPQTADDLFAALCAKGADTLIADARTVAARLPGWYRRSVNAGTFLLLPLVVKGATVGLIYADKAEPHSMQIPERELALLRSLRDGLVVAFARGA